MRFSNAVLVGALTLGMTACAGLGGTSPYPTQPVKVVIPYPAGNAADAVGRIVVDKLAQTLGQPVAVENRAGPTTVPGVDSVAKAPADGHTLLLHSVSYAVDAGLYTGLPYDPAKDLVGIAPLARQPFALVASPKLGVKTVAELVARSKAEPLKFGSLGPTTQIYFVGEQFKKQTGASAAHVPFKSLQEANEVVAKGEVAYWFPPVAGAVAGVRDGKLIALAVTSQRRAPVLAQTPTMAEAGVSRMESAAWFGLWAPAGTPGAVVSKLSQAVQTALASPEVKEKLARMGAEPMTMSPEEFRRFVAGETEASQRFVQELGIPRTAYQPPAR